MKFSLYLWLAFIVIMGIGISPESAIIGACGGVLFFFVTRGIEREKKHKNSLSASERAELMKIQNMIGMNIAKEKKLKDHVIKELESDIEKKKANGMSVSELEEYKENHVLTTVIKNYDILIKGKEDQFNALERKLSSTQEE